MMQYTAFAMRNVCKHSYDLNQATIKVEGFAMAYFDA